MPRLNLSEPFDRERGTFIAASTWDGSMEPVVQAEPLEAQMPSRSSSSNAASASTPSNPMFVVFGSLGSPPPLRTDPLMALKIPFSSLSRSALTVSYTHLTLPTILLV